MESRRLNLLRLQICVWTSLSVFLIACESSNTETDMPMEMVQAGFDPYCDTRPQFEFCEDFDTRDLPGIFEEQSVERAEMSIDAEDASSYPRSLLVSVESGGHGVLRHQFGDGGKLRLFGMLYVPELGDGDVEIAGFELGEYRVAFGVSSDGQLWGQEAGRRLMGEGTIPVGRWASFRWDVNLYDDGTGTAKLRFGNDFIVNVDTLTPPTSSESTIAGTVGLSEATGTWTMRFDNLTFEVKELTP